MSDHIGTLSSWISARKLARSVLLLLIVVFGRNAQERVRLEPFPVPSRVFRFADAATPSQYALLRAAIQTDWNKEKASQLEKGPALGSDFMHIKATRVQLGALGEGMIVYFAGSPQCGATGNCPMAIYVRAKNAYRRVIEAAGWGAVALTSGLRVPDVAFYSHMSAAETDSYVFKYADGKFVGQAGPVCTEATSANRICTGVASALSIGAISPADYEALRPQAEADIKKQAPAENGHISFDQAHAINILHDNRTVITVVEWKPCDTNGNCSISAYAHEYGAPTYRPLPLNAKGWGVSQEWDAPQNYIVVASNLSSKRTELMRYRLIPVGKPSD